MSDESLKECRIISEALSKDLTRVTRERRDLEKEISYMRSVCVSTCSAAHERYNKACLANWPQHDRLVLALQYRDYIYMFSRLFKTEMQLSEKVFADVKLLLNFDPDFTG